jgi:hypothetical protein
MTQREWNRTSDDQKQPWEEMQKKGFTNGNN